MSQYSAPFTVETTWKRWIGAALLALSVYVLGTEFAFAQGIVTTQTGFNCSGGTAMGELFSISGNCPTSFSADKMFSFFVCNIERITSAIFGNLYCGVIDQLAPMIGAVMTLAVIFFAIGFTTGIIPATAREFMLFFLKLVLMYVFATQAPYMIGIAYNFFILGAQDGIGIVMSTIFDPQGAAAYIPSDGAANLYYYLDNAISKFIGLATQSVGADVTQGQNPCENAIFAALALLAIAQPPFFFLAILLLVKIAMTFLRAVYGYLFALVGIAFLMITSPIFLSLGLFRQTRQWFDKWLGYLASMSLQMIIVFAFLAFIFSLPVNHIMEHFFGIIKYVEKTTETDHFRMPWEYCTLCDFEVVETDAKGKPTNTVVNANVPIDIAKHGLRCKTPLNYLDPLGMIAPQLKVDRVENNPNAPPQIKALKVNPNDDQVKGLLHFMIYGMLSLLVLAYVIDQLLSYIPLIAQTLASSLGGASYAPQMAGGQNSPGGAFTARSSTVDLPLEGAIGNFGTGFTRGFAGADNALSGLAAGIQQGTNFALSGTVPGRDAEGRPTFVRPAVGGGNSLVDTFQNFLINPDRAAD